MTPLYIPGRWRHSLLTWCAKNCSKTAVDLVRVCPVLGCVSIDTIADYSCTHRVYTLTRARARAACPIAIWVLPNIVVLYMYIYMYSLLLSSPLLFFLKCSIGIAGKASWHWCFKETGAHHRQRFARKGGWNFQRRGNTTGGPCTVNRRPGKLQMKVCC